MTDTQALAQLVYPHLPSGSGISFSEISTFQNCPRQHYWRYYVRLASKRYSELRNMVMGSVVHEATEAVYKGKDPEKAIAAAIKKSRNEVSRPSYAPYFDEGQFTTDMLIARWMFDVWYAFVYPDKRMEIVEVERPFDVTIAGQRFIGYIDRIYNVTGGANPGLYIGELKTRGYSFRKGLKGVVKKDLQTKIYLEACYQDGMDPQGVVYTILKKPHMALMEPMEAGNGAAIKGAIDKHYAEPAVGDHYKREIIPVDLDRDQLYADLTASLSAMDTFYANPTEGLAEHGILNERGFPCMFCEFAPLCHQGQTVDGSFRYKRKRAS